MAVNKVVYNAKTGAQTLIDLTSDTVTPATLAEGATAHDASGERIVGTMPVETIPNYVITEAENVIGRVIAAQGTRTFTFAAISDLHYGNGSYTDGIKHACQALKYIDSRIKLDAVAVLGDYTDNFATTSLADALSDAKEINALLDSLRFAPNLRQMGNHDYYDNVPVTRRLIQYYSDDVVWGNKIGGYYYKDYEDISLRVICLNVNEMVTLNSSNNPDGLVGMSMEQYNWFINSLDLTAKDNAEQWQILILSHQPLDWWHISGNTYVVNILDAYKKGTTLSDGNISCDFTGKNKATLIGNIHGHIHNFLAETMYLGDSYNKVKSDIYRISTPNACYNRENGYDGIWKDTVAYNKTKDSAKDTSFIIYCIDLDTNHIKAICYGAGIDRDLTYIDLATYVNEIPISINSDGTPYVGPNGEKGYKNGYRLNSSGVETAREGIGVTGFIPIKPGDVVYLKNCKFYNTGDQTPSMYMYFAAYKQDFTHVWSIRADHWTEATEGYRISNLTYDPDTGYLTSFTFVDRYNSIGNGYLRMSMETMNGTEIISINNPIVGEEESSSTNQIPKSINSDGTPYNGGQGWKTNTRLNYNGTETALDNWEVTGFIPVTGTSKIYFSGIDFNSDGQGKNYLALYDSNFATLGSNVFTAWLEGKNYTDENVRLDENGNLTYLSVPYLESGNFGNAGFDFGPKLAYIRISACGITNDSIITVDEPIE